MLITHRTTIELTDLITEATDTALGELINGEVITQEEGLYFLTDSDDGNIEIEVEISVEVDAPERATYTDPGHPGGYSDDCLYTVKSDVELTDYLSRRHMENLVLEAIEAEEVKNLERR